MIWNNYEAKVRCVGDAILAGECSRDVTGAYLISVLLNEHNRILAIIAATLLKDDVVTIESSKEVP